MLDLQLRRKPSGILRDFAHRMTIGVIGAVIITAVAEFLGPELCPPETTDTMPDEPVLTHAIGDF